MGLLTHSLCRSQQAEKIQSTTNIQQISYQKHCSYAIRTISVHTDLSHVH